MAKTIKQQLEEARAALAADTIGDDEAEEQKDIAALEETRTKLAERAEQRRDADLAKRLLAAREASPGVEMRSITVKEFTDTFIIRRNGAAHKAWYAAQVERVKKDTKGDHAEVSLRYALASVVDWNGKSVADTVTARELQKYLDANPGVVSPITDGALALNGALTEERKS